MHTLIDIESSMRSAYVLDLGVHGNTVRQWVLEKWTYVGDSISKLQIQVAT
jgi:hypothetical protein